MDSDKTQEAAKHEMLDRRGFLKGAGILGAALGVSPLTSSSSLWRTRAR
jgi:hypothetical protein